MKKLLLLSLLVLFGCSPKEEEIEEVIIEYPEINVQLYPESFYGGLGLSGERLFRELCCGSSTSDHCPDNPLLPGCYKNFGSAYMIDDSTGQLVYDLTTKCNSTIKIKVNPGEGWYISNIYVDQGYYSGTIEKTQDSEILINAQNVLCFQTEQTLVFRAQMRLITD
jgi:hypothetical protein